MTKTALVRPAEIDAAVAIIDTDVHVTVPTVEVLLPYLSDHWREYITTTAFKGPPDTAYLPHAPITARPGTTPEHGPPGSDLALLRAQVLEAVRLDTANLTCAYAVDSIHNPDAAAAIASAANDWLLDQWLAQDSRLRASLIVPPQLPEMAAREIDRLGDHPGFVQVLLPVRSATPYGTRFYHPIYAAAARHDLVVGIHFGGAPGNPPTGTGWPSYYIEEYAGMAQVFQSQLMSLIVEGVFDQFPSLRVALLESGVTWLPGFLWRFDKEWKGLRREVPWNTRLPSAYVREHVRLTTAPLDQPVEVATLLQVLEQLESDELLMYASDYPHQHDDDAPLDFLRHLPAHLAQKILAENARAFYRLSPSTSVPLEVR